MKWAVNMRTKTLTIELDPNEVMDLYVGRRVWRKEFGGEVNNIWNDGLGKIVEDAARAMFPLAFSGRRTGEGVQVVQVERVNWDEICDAD